MENPSKMDDLGVSPISGNPQMVKDFARQCRWHILSLFCVSYPTIHVHACPPTHLLHHKIHDLFTLNPPSKWLHHLKPSWDHLPLPWSFCFNIALFQGANSTQAPRRSIDPSIHPAPIDPSRRRHVVDLLRQWLGLERLCQCHLHRLEQGRGALQPVFFLRNDGEPGGPFLKAPDLTITLKWSG